MEDSNPSDTTPAATFEEVTPAVLITFTVVKHFDTRDKDEAVRFGKDWAIRAANEFSSGIYGGHYVTSVQLAQSHQ